jgi:hypothetical protein
MRVKLDFGLVCGQCMHSFYVYYTIKSKVPSYISKAMKPHQFFEAMGEKRPMLITSVAPALSTIKLFHLSPVLYTEVFD